MSVQVKEADDFKQVWCQVCDEQADVDSQQCNECKTIYCNKCITDQFYCIDGCLSFQEDFSTRFSNIDKSRVDELKNAKFTCSNCNTQFKLDKLKSHKCKGSQVQGGISS